MTVGEIKNTLKLNVINESDEKRMAGGVYAGDLLSWVMGHAKEDQILVTIMSNLNVLAVASLLDLPAVILTENVVPDEEFINTAKQKEINVYSSGYTTYEVCVKLSELVGNKNE